MSIYPKERRLVIDGETVTYPGLQDGKFTDGDPADPAKKPSFVPAESINLLLDNLSDVITESGLTPTNTGTDQLRKALHAMFPVGTIWMYDGANWKDNDTLPGWYACVPENEDGGTAGLSYGITSMVDRFVMGKAVTGSGATGGANSYKLASSQLPAHTHTINHDHAAFSSGNQSSNHTHTISGTARTAGNHTHTVYGTIYSGGGADGLEAGHNRNLDNHGEGTSHGGSHTHSVSGSTGNNAVGHTHPINVPPYTGNSGSTGAGDQIDNRPAFYSLIFIRKCA